MGGVQACGRWIWCKSRSLFHLLHHVEEADTLNYSHKADDWLVLGVSAEFHGHHESCQYSWIREVSGIAAIRFYTCVTMHTCVVYVHACTHITYTHDTHAHEHTHTNTHAHTLTHTHTQYTCTIHTRTYNTYPHTQYTRTHAHTHTYTQYLHNWVHKIRFVGSWPPFITGLHYDDPSPSCRRQISIKIVAWQLPTNTRDRLWQNLA